MAGPNLSQLKFLVVEDDPHMSSLVAKLVGELGVKDLVTVSEGGEALRMMLVFAPDIVISDWQMQPMDGIEMVKRIRQGEGGINRFVPVIMLTVHTERHRVREARDAGVNEFIAKPVSVRALYARIHQLIERPRAFVHTDEYFGPDRRRKQMPFKGPNRRSVMPWGHIDETKGAGLPKPPQPPSLGGKKRG